MRFFGDEKRNTMDNFKHYLAYENFQFIKIQFFELQ